MRYRNALTETAFLALTAFTVAAIFETGGLVRGLMSVLLVFVLPGRALLAAWFPHRLAQTPENILLTIIASIAVTTIGGLLLNLLPVGLVTQTWVMWLGGVAAINTVIALLRALRAPGEVAAGNAAILRPAQALLMVAAVVIVVGGMVVARGGALSQPRAGFTQLWMLPASTADAISIGVRNEEGVPVTYRLVVRQGEATIQDRDAILIEPAQSWSLTVPLPLETLGAELPIEARLYRTDQPNSVYRSVTLWLAETGSK